MSGFLGVIVQARSKREKEIADAPPPLMLQVSSSFTSVHTATTVACVLKPGREACHKGFLHPWVTTSLGCLRNGEPAPLPGTLFGPGGQLFRYVQCKDSSSAHTFRLLALEIIEAQQFLMHITSSMISKMCQQEIQKQIRVFSKSIKIWHRIKVK